MYSNVILPLLSLSQPWRPSVYTELCKHNWTQNIHVNLFSMNINDWKSIWVTHQLQFSSVSLNVNNIIENQLMCSIEWKWSEIFMLSVKNRTDNFHICVIKYQWTFLPSYDLTLCLTKFFKRWNINRARSEREIV